MTVIDHHHFTAPSPRFDAALRLVWRPVRYAGVLTVWLALFTLRPRLALEIWRGRSASRGHMAFAG